MLTVLINWFFILITSYSIGFSLLKYLARVLELELNLIPAPNIVRNMMGLVAVTVYAELWSLFGGVGKNAIIFLIVFTLVALGTNHKEMLRECKLLKRKKSWVYIILIILFSYGTSRGYMHFDTNLYHAQAIRWIEEFGIVPGLANLQSRFGYNSAEFSLNALYSFSWLLGRSLHCTAGYFALLSSFIFADISRIWTRDNDGIFWYQRIRVSDFIRIGMLFYLGVIFSEMISPASDYYAQLLIFDIVILWLDNLEISRQNSINMTDDKAYGLDKTKYGFFAVLCFILVYAITIKLSIGLLVLLAFVPACFWIKEKSFKKISVSLLSGLIIAVPYFIRNFIISGWILYPSVLINIGNVDWKMPKGDAQYDAKEIGMWGRGITSADQWSSVTATNWVGNWFSKLEMIEKLWVITSFISIIIVAVCLIWYLCKRKLIQNEIYVLTFVIAIGFVFWFFSAPLVRYGYAYLIILPLLLFGIIVNKLTEVGKLDRKICGYCFVILLAGMSLLKAKGLATDIVRTVSADYYIYQQDYIDGEGTSYLLNGVTIYKSADDGQIGYYKFPASIGVKEGIELRGKSLDKGFRHID